MRSGSDREVSMTEAAQMLAMSVVSVGQYANQAPPEFVRLKRGKRYLVWPGFMVWYRQRLKADRDKPTSFDDAKTRKMAADAELAELELARARGDAVSVESFRHEVREMASKVRAQLLAAPGRYSARIVGLSTLPDAQRQLDAIIRDVLNELTAA